MTTRRLRDALAYNKAKQSIHSHLGELLHDQSTHTGLPRRIY
jgi:hypothetical protein